jgi:hypothetical protein
MLAILIATLAHHIPEQDAPLRCVDGVFERGREQAERRQVAIATVAGSRRADLLMFRHGSVPSPGAGNRQRTVEML